MKNNMINNYKFEYDDENYKEEIKKYINISNNKKKISVYALGIALILLAILFNPITNISFIKGLLVIDIMVFVFNFASYLSYKSVIKLMEKHKICREKDD
ncbi:MULTISPECIES: hypothetical protein [unclassified Clostridium]|jgi:hypothetical protein|uniref:hypothetical protein n=1 Tax=unclassified Clostridium TaxID=2614128 RepID=UPI0025C42ABB|nr:hypothetical protein [Clostridium sp.]MCI6692705.1 hypothetical protein [Clostridium sp.]MDY2632716.1 hypothetical protein [Clostridium sp.]MDY6228194.1 hypothetical protein [Clostridium sp.]